MMIKVIFIMLLASQCRLDEAPARSIRGHNVVLDGIAHAPGAKGAERLCQSCHGINLLGGDSGEPSCLVCHGSVWDPRDSEASLAPAGHDQDFGGFYHQAAHQSPVGTCDSAGCHGADLGGNGLIGAPSCIVCHVKNWP